MDCNAPIPGGNFYATWLEHYIVADDKTHPLPEALGNAKGVAFGSKILQHIHSGGLPVLC